MVRLGLRGRGSQEKSLSRGFQEEDVETNDNLMFFAHAQATRTPAVPQVRERRGMWLYEAQV